MALGPVWWEPPPWKVAPLDSPQLKISRAWPPSTVARIGDPGAGFPAITILGITALGDNMALRTVLNTAPVGWWVAVTESVTDPGPAPVRKVTVGPAAGPVKVPVSGLICQTYFMSGLGSAMAAVQPSLPSVRYGSSRISGVSPTRFKPLTVATGWFDPPPAATGWFDPPPAATCRSRTLPVCISCAGASVPGLGSRWQRKVKVFAAPSTLNTTSPVLGLASGPRKVPPWSSHRKRSSRSWWRTQAVWTEPAGARSAASILAGPLVFCSKWLSTLIFLESSWVSPASLVTRRT